MPRLLSFTQHQVSRRRRSRAFTIVEVLVAVTLLLIIMAVTATVMDQATRAWRQTNTKIEAFQNARGVFEVITSRLTPATLNTYLDYYNVSGQAFRLSSPGTFSPDRYGRYSDLHFICGAGKTLVTTLPPFYSRVASGAVFFVTPTGLTATTDYRGTTGLLNASGFFIAFGSDKGHRPPYLMTPETYRWRLMELSSPTESLEVFGASSGNSWFRTPISSGKVRPVADNVIALIIWPRRPPADDAAGNTISSNYAYDSRTTEAWLSGAKQPVQAHQLPPTVQVTMVVIDDGAARRLDRGATPPPEITDVLSGLFTDNADVSGNLVQHYESDLQKMEQRLVERQIAYRVFSSTISLREAKWTP